VTNEKTVVYAEYENTGPGANIGDRVPWLEQLTEEEARKYTVGNIFRDWRPPTNGQ